MTDSSPAPNKTALTEESSPNLRFDVHLFAIVRVKFSDVAAASIHDAIPTAIERFGSSDFSKQFDGETTEFADEFSHFLVDRVGDAEFEQSRSLTSGQEPLLSLLDRLVSWDASGRPEELMAKLLTEVRSNLEWSV